MAEVTSLIGFLAVLEVANLGISVVNARQLGEDTTARKRAARALDRVQTHETRYHDTEERQL